MTMSTPSAAAKEIASFINHYVRGTTLGVHLQQYGGEEHIAQALQAMADEGHIYGIVATGDHEEDGKTVIDWDRLEPSRD
jgi:hypothetical protein